MLSIERLTQSEAGRLSRMTFPAYRHLLDLAPAPRHLADGDDRDVQPIAIGARDGTSIVGLGLTDVPVAAGVNAIARRYFQCSSIRHFDGGGSAQRSSRASKTKSRARATPVSMSCT